MQNMKSLSTTNTKMIHNHEKLQKIKSYTRWAANLMVWKMLGLYHAYNVKIKACLIC